MELLFGTCYPLITIKIHPLPLKKSFARPFFKNELYIVLLLLIFNDTVRFPSQTLGFTRETLAHWVVCILIFYYHHLPECTVFLFATASFTEGCAQ
jgi:hypothetical protein